MKLTSLKRTKAEMKARNSPKEMTGPYAGDEYGYGLCITLDKDALEKLGVTPSDFDVGDEVTIEAKGVIRSLRSSKGSSYNDSSVEIQFTKLGVEGGTAEDAMSRGIDEAEEAEEDEDY